LDKLRQNYSQLPITANAKSVFAGDTNNQVTDLLIPYTIDGIWPAHLINDPLSTVTPYSGIWPIATLDNLEAGFAVMQQKSRDYLNQEP